MRLLLLSLLFVAGCGYQTGQISSGEGKTIAVPMFKNVTYRRDLERDLTRFIRDEIMSRSSYTIVGQAEGADLVLTGQLLEVEEDVLSDRSKGRIRESSVAFTVHITLVDRQEGKTLIEDQRIIERASFVPVKGESIRSAEIAVMRRIGERVVYSLSSEW